MTVTYECALPALCPVPQAFHCIFPSPSHWRGVGVSIQLQLKSAESERFESKTLVAEVQIQQLPVDFLFITKYGLLSDLASPISTCFTFFIIKESSCLYLYCRLPNFYASLCPCPIPIVHICIPGYAINSYP